MPRVILIRHVQSEANRDGVGLGRRDSPPTPLGLQQAQALARALAAERIARVLTSPLGRASTAADAIAAGHGLRAEPIDALIEMDVGDLDGVSWEESRQRFADVLRRWVGEESHTYRLPGGESLTDVQQRAWPILAPLIEADASDAPGAVPDAGAPAIVIVTHNFVLRALLCSALQMDLARWRQFQTDLASRSDLARQRDLVILHRLNDTSHLAHLAPPD